MKFTSPYDAVICCPPQISTGFAASLLESVDELVGEISRDVMLSPLRSRGNRIAESIGRMKAVDTNDGAEVEMMVRGRRRIRKTDLRPLRTVDLVRPSKNIHALHAQGVCVP